MNAPRSRTAVALESKEGLALRAAWSRCQAGSRAGMLARSQWQDFLALVESGRTPAVALAALGDAPTRDDDKPPHTIQEILRMAPEDADRAFRARRAYFAKRAKKASDRQARSFAVTSPAPIDPRTPTQRAAQARLDATRRGIVASAQAARASSRVVDRGSVQTFSVGGQRVR